MAGAGDDLGILKSKGIEQISSGRCGGSLGGGVGIPCLGVADLVGDADKVGKFNGAVRSRGKAKHVYNLHFFEI